MRTFTRVVNMSPGLRDTGDEIDAAHINELQQAAEDLQTGALPIALAGIEGALGECGIANAGVGRVNALDYGASWTADDNVDQINAALDYVVSAYGGGEVYLPTGKTYPIKPNGLTHRIEIPSNCWLNLGDARLRVADDSPAYQTVITVKGGAHAATSNVRITGGEIDQNSLGHVASNVVVNKQFAFLAYALSNASIDDVSFLTCGANTININGTGCRNISIRRCHVEFVPGASDSPDYDNSAFYILSVGTSIEDNEFYGTYSEGTRGARGAFEIHGPLGVATGNRAYNYETLCNIVTPGTAVLDMVPDQSLVIVENNVLYGGRFGIRLWPLTGHALQNVGVRNNQIHIGQVSRNTSSWHGIGFTTDPAYRADTIGLDISGNVITFEHDDRADASGTEFPAASIGGIVLNGISDLKAAGVRSNTIVNSPMRGIQVGVRVTPYEAYLDDVTVEHNLLVNCGYNRSVGSGSRQPWYFRAKSYNNVLIRNNVTTVANADGTAGDQQYLYISDVATGNGNVFENNALIVNGGHVLSEVLNESVLPTRRAAAASTLGSVTGKKEFFDDTGVSLGFVPIYDTIT